MAYVSLNSEVVDFSQGACGPGRYKWTPNGTCTDLPSGGTLPEMQGPVEPPSLPGGEAFGWGMRPADFSGGSCGGGMVRPCPTCPCTQVQAGLTTRGSVLGDWVTTSSVVVVGGLALLMLYGIVKGKK